MEMLQKRQKDIKFAKGYKKYAGLHGLTGAWITKSREFGIMIIGKQENLTIDETGTTEKAKAGRKKKFSIRMFNALSQGMAWAQLIDFASK